MANSKNQIFKVDRLSGVCLANAIRLHKDAIWLFHAKSFASALALSILAMEEVAKAFIYEDIAWHAAVDETDIDSSLELRRKHILSHATKHRVFARYSTDSKLVMQNGETTFRHPPFAQLAQSAKLESMKQAALYAGLVGNVAKIKGARIHDPLKIRASQPQRMITFLNDYLIDLIIGVRGGWYGVDSDSMDRQLNRRLLKSLKSIWLKRGKKGLKAIRLEAKSRGA